MTLSSKVKTHLIAATALVAFAPAAVAQQQSAPPSEATPPADEAAQGVATHITVYGAVRDRSATRTAARPADRSVPELPVVYEDDAQPKG